MPVGMVKKPSPFSTASDWTTNPPTAQSSSPPSTYGRSSTSRSLTNTSTPSTISTRPSLNDAAPSIKTETSSPAPPNSIGGQNPASRTNHSEIVSPRALILV